MTRRILTFFAWSLILSFVPIFLSWSMPQAGAQETPPPPPEVIFKSNPYPGAVPNNLNPIPPETNTISTETSTIEFIITLINFLLGFLAIIALLVLIWAGYLWITALGNETQIEKSKKMILYTVIGIFLITASYAIINTLLRTLTY